VEKAEMNLTLDFTNIDAMGIGGGGSAPPEGAHKATITAATIEPSRNGTGQNMIIDYNVVEGAAQGTGCKAWFPLPTGSDAKKDAFKLSKMKRLFLSIGIPANTLAAQINLNVSDLVGKALVIYVEDDAERSAADGRRRYEAVPVLVEDAQSALAGQWSPRGGRTTTAAPQGATTPFNPMAPTNGLSAPAFGSTPMP
jgi:hypothetical protein